MDARALLAGVLLWRSSLKRLALNTRDNLCSTGHCWVFPERGKWLYFIVGLLGKLLLNSGSFGEPLTCPLAGGSIHAFYTFFLMGTVQLHN